MEDIIYQFVDQHTVKDNKDKEENGKNCMYYYSFAQ